MADTQRVLVDRARDGGRRQAGVLSVQELGTQMRAGTGEWLGMAGRGLHAVARAQAQGPWHPASRFGLAEGSRARFTNRGARVRAEGLVGGQE